VSSRQRERGGKQRPFSQRRRRRRRRRRRVYCINYLLDRFTERDLEGREVCI